MKDDPFDEDTPRWEDEDVYLRRGRINFLKALRRKPKRYYNQIRLLNMLYEWIKRVRANKNRKL